MADWVATDLENTAGRVHFTVSHRKEELGRVSIRLAGYHNVLNALTVLATAFASIP